MTRRRASPPSPGSASLHLLEVGLPWPPEAFLTRKLAGLAARGVRVSVASTQVQDPSFELPGVELLAFTPRKVAARARLGICVGLLALAVRSPRRLARLLVNLRRAPAVRRRRHGGVVGLLSMYVPLLRLRPDVVQFEWNISAVDHLPLFDVWDGPVATSCWGSDLSVYPHVPGIPMYAEGVAEVLRRTAAVHCVSEDLRHLAIDFGLDPAKARVILPAVDPDVFRPNGTRRAPTSVSHDPGFHLVTVAELRWEKGFEYALSALRRLVDQGVPATLEVIGGAPAGWPERERIIHTTRDLGIGPRVRLSGPFPAEELSRRVARADALLHPSLIEGIPHVVIEAMACGTPVVTTDCGGVREAVCHGVHGFVVDVRDPEQLADALFELWADPALRRRMGEAGRRTARERFTLSRQLDEYLVMYEELVG